MPEKKPQSQRDIKRYRNNLQGEVDGAALYMSLAEAEGRPEIADVYRQLAAAEERHAEVWRTRLREAGEQIPKLRPSLRARLMRALARRFGINAVLPMILSAEASDSHAYDKQPEAVAAGLPADERSHARFVRHLAAAPGTGLSGESVARLEGRHQAAGGNALRAAVLGANDGLVSNLSLVMGVAGASLQQNTILLAGSAGLLAGAISMALGEWLSVQSSRELYERQLQIEREELEEFPEEEQEELALIYQAKGVAPAQARELAAQLIADPTTALDTLAREELGIDPEGLGGSAWVAAITSFLLFAAGAIIPVLPFLVTAGLTAVLFSGLLSALGLFTIGAGITFFTGRHLVWSGLRQVAFGLAAAVVTFGLGKLVGPAWVSKGLLGPRWADDADWHLGVVNDVLRDATQQEVRQRALAARAHYDEISRQALRLAHDHLARPALAKLSIRLNPGLLGQPDRGCQRILALLPQLSHRLEMVNADGKGQMCVHNVQEAQCCPGLASQRHRVPSGQHGLLRAVGGEQDLVVVG